MKQTVTFVNEKQREAEEKLAERMKKIEDLSEQYVGLSELNLSADVNRDLSTPCDIVSRFIICSAVRKGRHCHEKD